MGALGDPYVDLTYMKAYTNIPLGNAKLDDILESAVQSASDQIELHCDRQFNRAEEVSARYFTPKTPTTVKFDDFWTTEGLIVEVDTSGYGNYTTVLTPSEYTLHPLNGVVGGQVGWPFSSMTIPLWMGYGFSMHDNSVRITAKWGWEAVPDNVKQATMLLANETFAAKGAPLGVAGSNAFGDIRVRQGMLWKDKVQRYVRTELLVG